MTTIERAKRFFKRIHYWAGEPDIQYRIRHYWGDRSDQVMMWCQARVARALIRQEQDIVKREYDDSWEEGFYHGLHEALRIIDAVYGREK